MFLIFTKDKLTENMNKNNIHQIFQEYIDKFDFLNEEPRIEYYKWQICNEYPILMKKALDSQQDDFPKALYEVKKCTQNLIDSYTTPFNGLVELSRKEPETVQKMFIDLYTADDGDLSIRMEKIADFFKRSEELLAKSEYSGSYLFKQNSHSISSYLFLNDPDNHYMYKASQCNAFEDCIEFYDDWGLGDNINLNVFHRMCDEVIQEIKESPELLKIDQSRFDARLKLRPGELHNDINKHILLFDIIYCSGTYSLYDGINYKKRNAKEKNLYLAEKKKAEETLQSYNKVRTDIELLDEALDWFLDRCDKGMIIEHKKYGKGIIEKIDRSYIVASFGGRKCQLSLPLVIANNIISVDIPGFVAFVDQYRALLKRSDSIQKLKEYYSRELLKYDEYLNM